MLCPFCQAPTKCLATREGQLGLPLRRRVCTGVEPHRFTTVEMVAPFGAADAHFAPKRLRYWAARVVDLFEDLVEQKVVDKNR